MRHKVSCSGAIVLLYISFLGCGARKPTSALAKELLDERIRADGKTIQVSYASVVPLLSTASRIDYAAATDNLAPHELLLKRLMEGKFVTSTKSTTTVRNVANTQYVYELAPAFKRLVTMAPGIVAGPVVVDAVSRVVLLSETKAGALFLWHVNLNPAASIVSGQQQTSGRGAAWFLKQTDGTWSLAEYKIPWAYPPFCADRCPPLLRVPVVAATPSPGLLPRHLP